METLLKWSFYACLALLPVSCWLRDDFVSDLVVSPELADAPDQKRADLEPFSAELEGVRYRIEPQYEYKLRGLVVSYQHHDGDRMLHRLWNDHLNVADVCVVWGRNATDLDLNAFEFWSGQFTCFFRTKDREAWRRFDKTALANNHLITEDPYLRDLISELRIGDQIELDGWLASYGNGDGYKRGTSVTRTDVGNGACETIYVKNFRILSSMGNGWRTVFNVSLAGAVSLAAIWVFTVMGGGFRHRVAR